MRTPLPLRSRLARAVTALALVGMTLTGCIKVDIDLKINPDDDTVSGSMVFAVEKSILQLSGKDPEDAFADAKEKVDDLPEGSRTETYDDGEYYGQRIIFEDAEFAAFAEDGTGLTFTHTDGKYTFTADLGAGALGSQADLIEPFLNSMEFRIAITFPGKVVQHNGDEIDGRTVVWDVKLGEGEKKMRAVSQESAFPSWIVATGICGLAVVLVVALTLILVLRQRRARHLPPDATPADSGAAYLHGEQVAGTTPESYRPTGGI